MNSYRWGIFLILLTGVVFSTSCGNRMTKKINNAWMAADRVTVTTDADPWKLVEGIYGYGDRYVVVDAVTQKRQQALSVISSGVFPDLIKFDNRGPYFEGKAGGKEAEQHRNQFLADLIVAQIDNETTFVLQNGDTAGLGQFTQRAMEKIDLADFAPSVPLATGPQGNELGWTLIAFSKANLVTSKWATETGKIVSFEDLLEAALARPVDWGSYEGLIEQLGIAVSVNEYKRFKLAEAFAEYESAKKKDRRFKGEAPAMESVALLGVWEKAQKHVDQVVEMLKKNQNSNGSFSKFWYEKTQKPENAGELILYSGHALDLLDEALPDSRLEEPWVRLSVDELANSILDNRYKLEDKFWAAAHAAHALKAYQFRIKNKGKPMAFMAVQKPCCD
ncbi:MAG: hypothetical protein WCX65_06040 [bacterium]